MGEGAAIVILEELEHAKRRGARILAELAGYGTTSDAYHITSPAEDGEEQPEPCLMQSGRQDLRRRISPTSMPTAPAHTTMTCLRQEPSKSVWRARKNLRINSTKSIVGHMLGAAGAIEFITCVKEIQEGYIHPTVGYQVPDEELDLNYVPGDAIQEPVEYALSNSLGFGGHNASILVKRYREEA